MITWATVGEVAELSFPDDCTVRSIEAVAVLEAHDADFGQRTVVTVNPTQSRLNVSQWREVIAVLDVDEDRVPVAKRSAADILTGHAERVASSSNVP